MPEKLYTYYIPKEDREYWGVSMRRRVPDGASTGWYQEALEARSRLYGIIWDVSGSRVHHLDGVRWTDIKPILDAIIEKTPLTPSPEKTELYRNQLKATLESRTKPRDD